MKCPRCQVAPMVSDRQGIEIDFCSRCRGGWLDRGELDKIVERASRLQIATTMMMTASANPQRPYDDRGDRYYHKRKSSWSQLFG